MSGVRIDFASEGCQWEVPSDDTPCPKPGAGLAGEWFGVYCREHLAIWRAEIERQNERDKARYLGLQDWYRRMARRQATGNVLMDYRS
jgi:hypothetical protein